MRGYVADTQAHKITYRYGAAGIPIPVLRGSGVCVQGVAVAREQRQLSPEEIAAGYGLTVR